MFDIAVQNVAVQRKYISLFKSGQAILELGCGRGDFLDLCRANGLDCFGVDLDPEVVRKCRGRGHRIVQGNAYLFLKRSKKKYDGIFCRHLIEHFPSEIAVDILVQCRRNLKKGGLLVLITPNVRNINVMTENFWKGFDHVRPYPREILEEKLVELGFEIVESGEDKESWARGPLRRLVRWTRSILVGIPYEAPDIKIIART